MAKPIDLSSPDAVRAELSLISRASGNGDVYAAMQDLFRGINHRGTGNPIAPNADHYGLTFFTRPRLNLSYHNCLANRKLHPLLEAQDTPEYVSMRRAIRAYLDTAANRGELPDIEKISSPLVDPLSPFINLLSNSLLSLTGWPDVTLDTYTATEGLMRETYTIVDSAWRDYSAFPLTASFKNMASDPITLLFHVWCEYILSVRNAIMNPYPDAILYNEIDYSTRIYRLVLDASRTRVTKIADCGAAIPVANPMGMHFNFDATNPINTDASQISLQFNCVGPEYADPVIVEEFNDLVKIFNPNMRNSDPNNPESRLIGEVNGEYFKVNPDQMSKMNYKGYPRINPRNMNFEIWAPASQFE